MKHWYDKDIPTDSEEELVFFMEDPLLEFIRSSIGEIQSDDDLPLRPDQRELVCLFQQREERRKLASKRARRKRRWMQKNNSNSDWKHYVSQVRENRKRKDMLERSRRFGKQSIQEHLQGQPQKRSRASGEI